MQSVNKTILQADPMYFLHIYIYRTELFMKGVEHFLVLGLFVLAIYKA